VSRLSRWLLLATAFAAPALFANTPSTMTTFMFRAWLPVLGAPVPATPIEHELLTVAADARRGAFDTAERTLERLGKSASSPRERLLVLLFRRQLLFDQYDGTEGDRLDVAGALFLTDAAAVSKTIAAEIASLRLSLPPAMNGDAAGAVAAPVLVRALARLPSAARYMSFADQIGDNASIDVAGEEVATMTSFVRQLGERLQRSRMLSTADVTAFERLADAAKFLGLGLRDEAVCILEQMLADAPAEARAEIMIALGDAYSAPDGSPFLIGTDPATADLQITALMMRHRLRPVTNVMPGDFERALAWYDSAEAIDPRVDVALRRTFTGMRSAEKDTSSELRIIADRPSGDRSSRAAGLMLGLLWEDGAAFGTAISGASGAHDFGAIASYAAVSRMIASRNSFDALFRAAIILEIVSESLRGAGFSRIAAPVLEDLAFVYHGMGRVDAAVVRARLAHDAVTAHLHELERRGAPAELLDLDREALASLTASAELSAGEATLEGRKVATPADAAPRSDGGAVAGDPTPFTPEVSALFEGRKRTLPLQKELTEKTEQIFSGDMPCQERLPLLAPYRQRAVEAGLRDWLLRFDVVNAACDPQQLARTRQELEKEDFIAPVMARAASLAAAKKFDTDDFTMFADELGTAMLGLYVLRYSRAWESLERFASRLQEAMTSVGGAMAAPLAARLLIAEARLSLGRHEEALALFAPIIDDRKRWDQVSAPDRIALLSLVLQGVVARCACDEPGCSSRGTLLALELIEVERVGWRAQRTGVVPSDRESAGVAANERRLATADSIPVSAAAGVQQARSHGLAITVHDVTGGLTDGNIDAALEALPNGTTALIYHRTFSGFIGWKVRNGSVEVRNISARAVAIEKDAAQLQRSVIDPLEGDWTAPAARLYAALVQPFEPLVPGDTLVVSAQGVIGAIPFEILGPDEAGRLLRRNAIVYATRFGGPADRLATTGGGALVAGLDGNGLAHAQREAATVAMLLGAQAITGRDVTAASLSAGLRAARYVHLAVHGVLAPENPFQSHLQLASGEPFEAWRLFRDAPSAEIIVLSACDMRSEPSMIEGDAASAGESMTFTSFALGGNARYVLGSAWRANDLVAERLTVAFWENIIRHGDDAPHALQRAKLALLAAGVTHPHYYTNFILSSRSIVAAAPPEK